MKSKKVRKKKVVLNSALAVIIGGGLMGCSANSESPEKLTKEKEVKKETTKLEDLELSDRQLIFKTDVEALTELNIPEYALKKTVKQYEVNEEVGGRIFTESGGMTSISYGEIGDETVSMDKEQAIAKANAWIHTAFNEFDAELLEKKEPVVAEMLKTELGDEVEESVIGYRIEYPNEYDGIKIQYEGISVMLDDYGVIYGNITWNEYEKIDSPHDYGAAQKVDFKRSEELIADVITKENKELGLDENSEDAKVVSNVELIFAEIGEESYTPVWYYEMEDGRTYYVNCMDGQANSL